MLISLARINCWGDAINQTEVTRPQPGDTPPRKARRVPGQVLPCGWCGVPITVAKVGRTPKWCSSSCRHRAWETSRAAPGGLVAVQIVDRTIEVPVTVIEHVEVPTTTKGAGWADALNQLAHQVDTGKVYDRDLPALVDAVDALITALTRRPRVRRRT